ncbi:MAG: tRNA (adenosine(37)-N6)-dimethylallyltransferase MiaA [Chromatiales bacterium]|jgi:tRNA dimethylallyltransferase|nr:tRNA (adenosine(37)-N6)-dimethylallyltransferase MiaA [Chromatiales bacterium]
MAITAICLMGPTASGKTALAVEVARRLPVAVISVDSAMVYRGLDIGTGKPDAALRAEVPHALIDIREPWEAYSAGDFARDARRAIEAAAGAGRVPLLVGGTHLYFRSLVAGIAPLPAADPSVRAAIDVEGEALGWPALHAELARVDPAAAARIGPADRQRIQRALEVYRLTGRPLSAHWHDRPPEPGFRFRRFALVPADRAALHAQIERRFDRMLEQGLVAEVAALRALPGMSADRPALRAVGYRQLWAHVSGEEPLGQARDKAIAATRQLARRQLTWLRAETEVDVLDPGGLQASAAVLGAVADAISQPSR